VGARHCGILGNELADQRDKQASAVKDDPPHLITLSNAVTAVKQLIKDTAQHPLMVEPRLYTTSTASEGTVEISSRKDDVSTVAQLHSDHGNLLQS